MGISKKLIAIVRRQAVAQLCRARGSHGFDHTERVLALALHIGRAEKADLGVLELAALLHDIGRKKEDASCGRLCHAEEGARMAERFLRSHRLDDAIVNAVVHCIRHHRFRGTGRPDTLEARILFDADKLDAIGAVGIGRAFLFAGEVGAKLHNAPGVDPRKTKSYGPEDTAYREFLVKLRHIHRRMLTREGRRLARARHAFMLRFFRELVKETRGAS